MSRSAGRDRHGPRRRRQRRRRCRRISWQSRIKRAAYYFSCSCRRVCSTPDPRNERMFILPFFRLARRPKVTKDAVIARSCRSEPRFFSFLARIAKPTFDLSRATPLRFLKKSLTACSVLTRCEMLQHGYNGSEMGPYLYEASALSTTIALHCEVARVSNRCMC